MTPTTAWHKPLSSKKTIPTPIRSRVVFSEFERAKNIGVLEGEELSFRLHPNEPGNIAPKIGVYRDESILHISNYQ